MRGIGSSRSRIDIVEVIRIEIHDKLLTVLHHSGLHCEIFNGKVQE